MSAPASPSSPAVTPFPVVRAGALEMPSTSSPLWLIENLWSARAVGIIGGAPKSLKTWLALEMAVALASGSPCLGSFIVRLLSGQPIWFPDRASSKRCSGVWLGM